MTTGYQISIHLRFGMLNTVFTEKMYLFQLQTNLKNKILEAFFEFFVVLEILEALF